MQLTSKYWGQILETVSILKYQRKRMQNQWKHVKKPKCMNDRNNISLLAIIKGNVIFTEFQNAHIWKNGMFSDNMIIKIS